MGNNTEFQAQAKRLGIEVTHSEAEQSNQNHAAEREISELKKKYKKYDKERIAKESVGLRFCSSSRGLEWTRSGTEWPNRNRKSNR